MKAEILSKNEGNQAVEEKLEKTQKNLQKGIDKAVEVWYNLRVAAREGVRKPKANEFERNFKKLSKTS